MTFAKQFVFKCQQFCTFNNEVAAAQQTHGFATSGAIKRFGNRRAPVNNNGLPVRVGNGETTNVEVLDIVVLGNAIDTAEHQSGIAEVELFETVHQVFVKHVAFKPCLECSARSGRGELSDFHSARTACLEAFVGEQDVLLLLRKFRVLLGHGHQSLSAYASRNGVNECYRRTHSPPPGRDCTFGASFVMLSLHFSSAHLGQ